MSESRSASERAWGGGRTGAGCVDKRGFSPLVRWCFFRPAREGKTSGFWEGNARGGRAVSPGSDEIVPGWEAHLRHRGGPALDGDITPRVGVGRGLSHVSLLSENSSKRRSADGNPRLPSRASLRPCESTSAPTARAIRRPSRAVEFTPNRVDDPSERRGPPSHYAPTARAPHASECSQHLDEEKASALVSRVCRSTVVSRAVYRRWVRPRVSPDPGLRARGYPRARRLAPRRNGTLPLRYRCAQPNLQPRRSASQADCRSPQSFFFPV